MTPLSKVYVNINLFKKLILKCKKFFLVFTILVFIFSSVDYGIFVKASGLLDNHIKIEKKEKNPRNGKVLYEVKSERSSYEKVFRKDDGSYEVVTYQEPVHYLENGNWEEIDNSIIEDNSGDYTNKRNSVKIKMPKKLDDNKKITLKYHNQKLEFSVLGINKSESEIVSLNNDTADIYIKRNNNSIVRYKNVLDNVDIEYIIQGESLKENIILNEYKENFSLSFIIDAYGLEAIQTEAGNIEFIKDNQIVYIIDKMFMTDVLGNYSDKVSMTIEKNDKDKYIFTVKPDDKWLKTAKYPVNIDPTYRLDYGKISDAYIRVNRENQEEGYINYGNSPLIKIGQDDSIIILMFGYIKFTVPSILNGKLMTYADLNLYVDNLSGCPTKGCRVNAYRIKSSWDESTINVYNSPDVDFSLVADYQFIKTAKSYVKFDITDTAKYWETYGGNNGIYLSIPNLNEFVDFASSEYGTASLRPVFHVGYIDTTGLEDYWTYQSQSLNQAGVGYVNTVSGDLTWVLPLYTNPTIRTPFNLSLIHNSNASTNNMGYGKGWRTSFNEKISSDDDGDDSTYYYLIDSDGTKKYFSNVSCTEFGIPIGTADSCGVSEDGSFDYGIFGLHSGPYPFEIHYKDGTIKRFDFYGRLTNIVEPSKNSFNIYYNSTTNQISSIIDTLGNTVSFSYVSGILNKITLPDGNYYKFNMVNSTIESVQLHDKNAIPDFKAHFHIILHHR